MFEPLNCNLHSIFSFCSSPHHLVPPPPLPSLFGFPLGGMAVVEALMWNVVVVTELDSQWLRQ